MPHGTKRCGHASFSFLTPPYNSCIFRSFIVFHFHPIFSFVFHSH
ncbi:hypothetical protein BVRB_2g033600 [Beta vulgaris subsp. vulgaris]|nr:hypothetical protein BVRB_2g033600 [Beta vulgaris subsp. vulgaris]